MVMYRFFVESFKCSLEERLDWFQSTLWCMWPCCITVGNMSKYHCLHISLRWLYWSYMFEIWQIKFNCICDFFSVLLKIKIRIEDNPEVPKVFNHQVSLDPPWLMVAVPLLAAGRKTYRLFFLYSNVNNSFGANGTLAPWLLRVLQQLLELNWHDSIIHCQQHIVAFLYFYRHLVSYWRIGWIKQDQGRC